MNALIKKFLGFSVGPVAGAAISFITIPLTTLFVRPEEYGKAGLFLLLQMIIGTFLFLGLDQAYTRDYHEVKDKILLFQNALLPPLILSILVLMTSLIFPHLLSRALFGHGRYPLAAILFGLMILFMVLERFILLSLRMQEKALEYSLLNIFVKLTVLILTLVFVLWIRRDFLAVIYSTVLGQISGDLYLLFRYRRLFNVRHFVLDRRLLRSLLRFGLPILVATSLSSLLNGMNRLSLRLWSDFAEIGIFTATLKIASLLSIVQTSFTTFWVPTAYRWYAENQGIANYQRVSNAILLIMSLMASFIFIFKDWIVFLLSAHYAPARFLIGFLCLQPLIYTVSETTGLGIVFSKRSYLSIWVSVLALIPNLILNIMLVPRWGAIGAAIATAVSYFFFFSARSFFSSRNWLHLNLRRHYTVMIILLAAAFLNLLPIPGMPLLNGCVFLLILAVQWSTIKDLWTLRLKNNRNPL
ncbi:MAG: lipopolysaccharide biosynthesis protein [Sporolactobacillus sp.]